MWYGEEDKLSDNKAEKIIDLTLCVLDLTATGGIPILSSIKETAKCIKDIPNEIFLIKLDRFIKAVTSMMRRLFYLSENCIRKNILTMMRYD